MFNMLLRLDFTGEPPQGLALPPGHCLSEPVHVPASQPGHDGWLLTVVDQQTGPSTFSHALWIIDAGIWAPVRWPRSPFRIGCGRRCTAGGSAPPNSPRRPELAGAIARGATLRHTEK